MCGVIWILFLEAVVTCFGAVVQNGGYEGITIAISEDTQQPLDCSSFLGRLERSFIDASSALHTATDRRVFFRSATVLLPTSWEDCSKLVEPSSGESYNTAEFRVETSSPLFGDALYTQQSKGCGKRGDFVHVPMRFFSEGESVYGPKGKALLHEWAKVRYGVFDEFGFPGDRVYPTFYESEEKFIHSGCSNVPINGVNSCNPALNDTCQLQPSGDNSKVTSSLMYMHYLDNVSQFCSSTTHNRLAPTKHNILCEGRSTKDVIFDNSDLRNTTVPVNITRTVFTYKRSVKTRFVLVIDVSRDMESGDHFQFVRSAIRRFILKDLPQGTELGLATFSDTSANLTSGTMVLTDENARKVLFALVPQTAGNSDSKCILCAVNTGIQILETTGSAAGHSIIIITTPLRSIDIVDSIENAAGIAKQKKVRVSVIAFSGSFDGHSYLTSETSGYQGLVPLNAMSATELNLGMLTSLGGELLAALSHQTLNAAQAQENPITIHEQASNTTSVMRGSFILEETNGRDTIFAVYFYNRRHGVRSLNITFPNGTTLNTPVSDEESPSYYLTPLIAINQPGTWQYALERDTSLGKQPHIVKVTTRQYATSVPKLTTRVFSSIESLEGDATVDAVKLYTEVKFGRQPVLMARVEATVTSKDRTFTVELLDNGNGDPDVTGNDGVYSRYLTGIIGDLAQYSISVSVNGRLGEAFTVYDPMRKPGVKGRPKRSLTSDPQNMPLCCGSFISVPERLRQSLPSFSRIAPGPLLVAKGYQSTSLIPPSRISDLRVEVMRGTANWTFLWTAPGDDFDSGRVSRYDFRYTYDSRLFTEERFDSLPELRLSLQPNIPGELEVFTGNFDHLEHSRPVFFAIRAIDSSSNKGKISNIVEAYRPRPIVTTTPSDGGPTTEGFILSDAAIAGIAVGAALALGLILLVIVICLKRRKPKDTHYKKNLNGTSLKKEMVETERKGSISVIPTSTEPIHWSASELLQEHEKRNRNSTYEPQFGVVRDYQNRYASMDDIQNDTYPRGSYSSSEYKVAPPTLPKPKRPESQLGIPIVGSDLGSQSSLASDKRKRNITQV